MKQIQGRCARAFACACCLLLLLGILTAIPGKAQSDKHNRFNFTSGYGAETNDGNRGFMAGIGYTRMLDKVDFSITGQYFVPGHLNSALQQARADAGISNTCKSFFITPAIGYHILDENNSPIRLNLLTGVGLRYYNYALPAAGKNNTGAATTPGNANDRSFYLGLHLAVPVSNEIQVGLFADTYSSQAIAEHILSGVQISVCW